MLGSDAAYREWGYVALSRARDATRLYVVDSDPGSRFVDALGRSNAQDLATDHGRPALDPAAAHLAALKRQQRVLARELAEAREHRDACQTRLDTARADLGHGLRRWRHRDRIEDLRRDIARTRGDLTECSQRVDRLGEEHAAKLAMSVEWEQQRPEVATPPLEVLSDSLEAADEQARRVLDLLDGPPHVRRTQPAGLEVGIG